MVKYYNTFDDWFYEIESHSLRAERFFSTLDEFKFQNNIDAEAIKWLRAAFNAGHGTESTQP